MKIPARRAISATVFLAFFLLKILAVLLLIYSLLFLCRLFTPRLGHRAVYFGQLLEGGQLEGAAGDEQIGKWERKEWEEKKLNERRLEWARKVLNRSTEIGPDGQKPHWLSIGIVTAPRGNGELTQAVGHLLSAFWPHPGEAANFPRIMICNAQKEGKTFAELDSIISSNAAQQVSISLANLNTNKSWPVDEPSGDQIFGKESTDYWNCLGTLAREWPGAKYFLLLEDDALPVPEIISRALTSIAAKLDGKPWVDYVKLYHPWPWRGIPWAFQSAAFSAAIGLLAHQFIGHNHYPLPKLAMALLLALGTHLIIRHQFYQLFSELRFFLTGCPLLTMPESCCTQAILFRATSAQAMAQSLGRVKAVKGHAKDHLLDESPFRGRQTDLNLVVHIGWHSVLRGKTVPTGEIFV